MKQKKIASLVVAAIGTFLVAYALYAMNLISNAKNQVNTVNQHLSGSYMGKMMGKGLSNQASKYDNDVRGCLIAGIVLVIAGGGAFFHFNKHRQRH